MNRTLNISSVNSNPVVVYSTSDKICCVKDLFPKPYEQGVFRLLKDITSIVSDIFNEFDSDTISGADIEYIFNKSGSRIISNLIKSLDNKYGTKTLFIPFDYSKFIKVLATKYSIKWRKDLEILLFDFDALSPYDMSITDGTTENMSSRTERSNNGNETYKNYNYGFNSPDRTPSNDNENVSTSNSNDTYERDNSSNRNISRKGNIGNITKQELIERQLAILTNSFWTEVFKDLDKTLTIPLYYDC